MVENAIRKAAPVIEPLWSTKQTAEYLGLSPRTVRALVKRGELKATPCGEAKKLRYKPSWVDDYLERCAVRESNVIQLDI